MMKIYKVTFTDLASTLTDLIPAKNEAQAIKKVKKEWKRFEPMVIKVEIYKEVE